MPIEKKLANKVLASLDDAAGKIESLSKAGKVDPRLASALIRDIDGFADKFEASAFGAKNLDARKAKLAKVLQKDKDEAFMDTFDNPNKVIESDADEEFLHKVGPSFNSKGINTFDQDQTTTVTDRDEHVVRDLSDLSDATKKQPSWSGGPAGKSTKQGSTLAQRVAAKSWSA